MTFFAMEMPASGSQPRGFEASSQSPAVTPLFGGRSFFIRSDGDDEADGRSHATAWRTVGRVNANLQRPLDTYYFRGSDHFVDAPLIPGTGANGRRIRFTSYGEGRATISQVAVSALLIENVDQIVVDSLVFSGSGGKTSPGCYVHINDNADHSDINIVSCHVSGFASDGIRVFVEAGSTLRRLRISSCDVEGNTLADNVSVGGTAGINICGTYASQLTGTYQLFDVVVADVNIRNNPGAAGAPNWTGAGVFIGNCDGGICSNSFSSGNGAAGTGSFAFFFADSKDVVGRFLTAIGQGATVTDGGGLDLDAGCINCKFEYCFTSSNAGPGMMLYAYSEPDYVNGAMGNAFRFCISVNDALQWLNPIFFSQNGDGELSGDFYNCVVYSARPVAIVNVRILSAAATIAGRICNCIFFADSASTSHVAATAAPGSNLGNVIFTGNNYYNAAGASKIIWQNVTYESITAWRAAYPAQETIAGANCSMAVDPIFVNAGADDPESYKLRENSTMIRAGIDLYRLFGIDPGPHDHFGNSIESAYLDIGAHKYSHHTR